MSDNEKPPIIPVLEHYGFDIHDPGSGWFKVKCQFHDDTMPSATVNAQAQVYKCFVCDVGGDAYEVIMWKDGCDFISAKSVIKEIFGEDFSQVSQQPARPELRTSLHVSSRGARAKPGNNRRVQTRRRRKLR